MAEAGDFATCRLTADKLSSQELLADLDSGARYYFKIRSYTPAHDLQQSDLWSPFSEVVMAMTETNPACLSLSLMHAGSGLPLVAEPSRAAS